MKRLKVRDKERWKEVSLLAHNADLGRIVRTAVGKFVCLCMTAKNAFGKFVCSCRTAKNEFGKCVCLCRTAKNEFGKFVCLCRTAKNAFGKFVCLCRTAKNTSGKFVCSRNRKTGESMITEINMERKNDKKEESTNT